MRPSSSGGQAHDERGIVVDNHSVPEALRERLGREATLGLLELIETKQMVWSDRVMSITFERFERRLAEELATLRVALVREIHDRSFDVLKWMFAFWVGQFFAYAGLLAFFLSRAGR